MSAIVSAGHVFLQQPAHPTYAALHRLKQCMNHVYGSGKAPAVAHSDITPGLVCAVAAENNWYRVMVTECDAGEGQQCTVRFLDDGGFAFMLGAELKQIREDFLRLPVQAVECYLSNVAPIDDAEGWFGPETALALEEIVSNKLCTAQTVGFAVDQNPLIELYAYPEEEQDKPVCVNRELVDRGVVAYWQHYHHTDEEQS